MEWEGLLPFRRIFLGITGILFTAIFFAALWKKGERKELTTSLEKPRVQMEIKEISIKPETCEEKGEQPEIRKVDRVRRLFSKGKDKLPIVETITYTSSVPWLKGRPAWIADYASHYNTSKHFIARSLNGKPEYLKQDVAPGDKFNVFRSDKEIEFYLLVDLSRCTMDFYYLDKGENERVFLKSYPIGVGRLDSYSPSGSLTPLGKYLLGSKVAMYRPGDESYFQNRKTHMVEVFGTRWLPFQEEISGCTDSAKGYGLHGVPCKYDAEKGELIEDPTGVGGYNSDGCIRLSKSDIEEIYAIVVSKPTVIEIVKEKKEAILPMARENFLDE